MRSVRHSTSQSARDPKYTKSEGVRKTLLTLNIFLQSKIVKLDLQQNKITFPAVYDMYCFGIRNIYISDETFYASALINSNGNFRILIINSIQGLPMTRDNRGDPKLP